MASLRQVVEFNERYNDDGHGGPWTLEGRSFVVDEVWKPMHSYNAWPAAGIPDSALCDACRRRKGVWVFDPDEASPHPPASSCPGLVGVPIITTGADVPRRSGKTTNGLALPFGTCFLEPFERWAYIASAEDQSEELVLQGLASKIKRQPRLMKLCNITTSKIEVPRNQSWLEVLPSSFGSTTGRGFTGVIFDEARDQKARVVSAILPSIMAEHGYKCPKGHGRWGAKSDGSSKLAACPKCGARLRRWHARLLLLSASGLIEGSAERDWFRDFIDIRLARPDPTVHVWRTDKVINPAVSSEIRDGLRSAFSDVPGMRDYMGVELDNVSARKGEPFATIQELTNVFDPMLRPAVAEVHGGRLGALDRGSPRPAIAFVDTSRTRDKTSLVVCVDESRVGEEAFSRLALAHVQVWNPADAEVCPLGVIDDKLVLAHLELVVPLFPKLLKLKVDTRIMPWAKQLVADAQKRPWGKAGRVEDFEGNAADNSAMYLELMQRIGSSQGVEKALRLFPHEELKDELLALRKKDQPGGGIVVYDQNAGKDGRNRKVGGVHRDIAMSLAACCLLAAELRLELRGDSSWIRDVNRGGAKDGAARVKPIVSSVMKERF